MELFNLMAKLTLDSKEYNDALKEAQRDADNFEMPETPELELETNDFEAGLEEAEAQGEGFGETMKGVFEELKGALAVTGVVAAINAIVSGIKEAINPAANTGDEIDKGSKRLNISTQAYQSWNHALKQSGTNIDTISKGISNFNKYIASFQPGAVVEDAAEAVEGAGGDMAQAFARLGVDVKDANGNLKTTEQLIEDSLLALADFKGSAEERGVLVEQLFGRGGKDLNAFLDEGIDGVKELLGEAGEMGLIMSEEEIQKAVKYGDTMANLQNELDAIKIAFVEDIIPVLTDAAEWLTDILTKLNPRLKDNPINEIFEDIDKKTAASVKQIDELEGKALNMVEQLAALGDYWSLDEEGKKTWDELARELVNDFPELNGVIDENGKHINGNTKEIKDNIKEWSNMRRQRLIDQNIEEKQAAVLEKHAKALDMKAEAAIKDAEAEGKRGAAIKDLNAELGAAGMDQLDENASYEEFLKARSELAEKYSYDPDKAWKVVDITRIGQEYQSTTQEAQALRSEAENMQAEADAATEHLTAYAKALGEQYDLVQTKTDDAIESVRTLKQEISTMPSFPDYSFNLPSFTPHAIGSDYIPYDNYPALLHRGEKVLTATEARQMGGADISLSQLASVMENAVINGMSKVNIDMTLDGNSIAKSTSSRLGNDITSRRFRP